MVGIRGCYKSDCKSVVVLDSSHPLLKNEVVTWFVSEFISTSKF